jgi:hypothetical protein
METQGENYPPDKTSRLEIVRSESPSHQFETSTTSLGLRFPRPEGNRRLAHWLANSSPALLQHSPNMSDPTYLDGSLYELVNNTDTESQDGRVTDYTSDADGARTDDVHSLGESDHIYDSESDDEQEPEMRSESIRYADKALESPSTQLPLDNTSLGASRETVTPPIEFREGGDDRILQGNISVKHTIREFNDDETAQIVKSMGLAETPGRLVATIHQTMASECLSTKEPFHILYLGSLSPHRDIVNKISSAICASSNGSCPTSGIYNICQMTGFLSTQEAQVEMMPLSPYSIKVECLRSAGVEIENGSVVGSFTLDHDRTYRVREDKHGRTSIDNNWARPHVAIFYCSEFDDKHVRETRNSASMLLDMLEVPKIFISDNQTFSRPPQSEWGHQIGTDAVHMCLESRDNKKHLTPCRLPIDLPSFLNIDARQMNRNLAYLMNLTEKRTNLVTEPSKPGDSFNVLGMLSQPMGFFKLSSRNQVVGRRWWSLLSSAGMSLAMAVLGSLVFSLFTSVFSSQGGSPQMIPSPLPTTTVSTIYTRIVHASVSTVTVDVTSTKTVKISQTETAASNLASAFSYAGFLSDKPASALPEPESKGMLCAVEIYSKDEILVKLPSSSKAAWLAKGAIDIDVHRGNLRVKSKISSIDEGIIVQLNKKDAWGTLNVSVVTNRRPKLNETFEVHFSRQVVIDVIQAGMSTIQDFFNKASNSAEEAARRLEDTCTSTGATGMDVLRDDFNAVVNGVVKMGRAAQEVSTRATVEAANRLKTSLSPQVVSTFTQEYFQKNIGAAEKLRDVARVAILQAQINSKLWWLHAQGKKQEHDDYQKKAVPYILAKQAELSRTRKAREESRATADIEARIFGAWRKRIYASAADSSWVYKTQQKKSQVIKQTKEDGADRKRQWRNVV